MNADPEADYTDEASILLDALVLLSRGVGSDLDAPITKDDPLSVVPESNTGSSS